MNLDTIYIGPIHFKSHFTMVFISNRPTGSGIIVQLFSNFKQRVKVLTTKSEIFC